MIEDTNFKTWFEGDGANRRWQVTFPFNSYSDLKIFTVIDNHKEEVTAQSEWSAADTSFIYPKDNTDTPVVPIGGKVLVERYTPLNQDLSSNYKSFSSGDIEKALDKLTMQAQELSDGLTAEIQIGTVETLPAGSDAVVENVGSKNNVVLNFGIPKGQDAQFTEDQLTVLNSGITSEKVSQIESNKQNIISIDCELDTISSKIPDAATSSNQLADKAYVENLISNIELIKIVDTLPTTGDTKYIYAVPQDERTIDGELIVLLNIWTGTEWAAVGAINTSGDLTEYLKKTEAESTYLNKTTGGTLSAQLFTNSFLSFNTSGRGIIFPSGGQVVGFDTGNVFMHNANNGIILRKSDNQLIRRRNNVDSIILTEAEKAIANGVASLDSTGKVPQEQLPISFTFNEETGDLNITAG